MNDSSTPIVGIFADDLTGALDAASPFAARGLRTLVSPSHEMPDGASKADVISLNLGSRHMAPAEIAVRTVKAVNSLKQFGVTVLMNKVDSTLRGNPGVELVAALNAIEGEHAVLCSAYPQNGRTVVDGILLVNEIPVADTDVGQDQLSPLPSSNVSEIIISSLERSGIADKAHVRSTNGGAGVSDFRPLIITPDASSEYDLFSLASRLLKARAVALVAGSAGLSTAIADALVADRAVQKRPPNQFVLKGSKILVVTASQRQIVDAQINALGGNVDLIQTELSVDEVLKGITNDSVSRLIEVTQRDGVVVLKLGKLKPSDGVSVDEIRLMAETIVCNLGDTVRKVTEVSKPDTLVIIGGDTSSGIFDACGVTAVELSGELQPGTVSGTIVGGSISGTLVVSRAGGFGDENSLFELVTLLKFGHNV